MHRFLAVRWSFVSLAIAVLALVTATACNDDPALPKPEKTGKLSIQLKTSAGEIKRAVVTISEIYANGAPEGRVVLSTTPFTVDLMTLTNQTVTLLENAEIPNGSYPQLRFVISGAYVEVENTDGGTSIFASSPDYPGLPPDAAVDGVLSMAGETQVGAPVTLPGGALLIRGDQRSLLVDFNVQQSFSAVTGYWRLSPVLSASDLAVAGTVVTTVELDPLVTLPTIDGRQLTLADFSVVITRTPNFRAEKPLTDSNGDEIFLAEFGLLAPGTYTVTLTGPDGVNVTTTPLLPLELLLGNSETRTQPIRILGVSVFE